MNLKQIKSSTIALLVAGVLILSVGTYTTNGGFQLAGGLVLLVAIILAISQASNRTDTGE
ncbi:hypothetical protein ACFONC_02665 [Luteimonas soli]|uniref:Uncharacterized protein n=1 Tax=Luteimonas soli TaxID=1648966 RepID=A0ABV7XHU3_9GAMM